MKIVETPDQVLNQIAKPVLKLDRKLLDFIAEMQDTLVALKEPKGVGLASAQVGRSLRLFITKPWEHSPFTVFINPEIIWISEEKTTGVPQRKNKFEGCLSIPDVWGTVHRAKKVKVRYQEPTINNRLITRTRTFSGFMATIIQHEIDHINGILFTSRVLEQKEKLYKLVKSKDGKETFEPLEV